MWISTLLVPSFRAKFSSYFPAQKCPFCASIPFQSSAQGGFVGFSIRRWAVHASPTPLSGIAVPVSFRCE
jgi:hypothetical protein